MAKKKPVSVRAGVASTLASGQDWLEPHGGNNVSKHLFEIFYWQEVEAQAKKALAIAWATAQDKDGPLDSDDKLRGFGAGEHIIAESEQFSALINVQEPRQNFDREAFFVVICRKFGIKRDALNTIIDQCKTLTKAPLSKRIVEA